MTAYMRAVDSAIRDQTVGQEELAPTICYNGGRDEVLQLR